MAEQLYLKKRLTHKYNDSAAHLDRWQHVGWVKLLAPRRVEEGNGMDFTGVWASRVVAPVSLKHHDLRRAINDVLSYSGCSHDYDCCGCASASATVKRVSKREYTVSVSTYRNY